MSLLIVILFPLLITILILMLPIFDSIQQKLVRGNDDLHPVKVIAADPDVDWAAEEGLPSGMVCCYKALVLT